MKSIFLGVLCLSLVGCASTSGYQRLSSGSVGCAPMNVVITDAQSGWITSTWTASCNGVAYYCTANKGNTVNVSCAQAK